MSNKQNKLWRMRKGFTLTEVLTVVLIIAVITAVAYPLYTKAISKSRAIEAVNLLEIVRSKQIAQYVRTRKYYDNFPAMGQLTNNKSAEVPSGGVLKINDYKLEINSEKDCLSSTYDKGGTKFKFSISYTQPGLGCTGDICDGFGNIVGKADEVCVAAAASPGGGGGGPCGAQPPATLPTQKCGNCGTRTGSFKCENNNWITDGKGWGPCNDPCAGCAADNTAVKACKNSGGKFNIVACKCACPKGTTEINGVCVTPAVCTAGKTQSCGICGEQICKSDGSGWGACAEKQQPAATQECGCNNAGTKTRTNMCDKSTATWTEGVWGGCSIAECECTTGHTRPCSTCGAETCGSDGKWSGSCVEVTKPADSQNCGCNDTGTQTRTVTCTKATAAWSQGAWGKCSIAPCVCTAGAAQPCGVCGRQICNADGMAWDKCVETPKPADIAAPCGNCGAKTDTHTCDTANASWTKTAGSCKNEGVCKPGSTKKKIPNCKGAKCLTLTCNDKCQWETPNPGGGSGGENNNPPVSAVKSSRCCPTTYRCGCDRPADCPECRGAPWSGGFDFNAQYCTGGKHGVWYSLFSCHGNPDYVSEGCRGLLPPQNGGPHYCGKIQLYECPNGYSFDSAGKCVAGSNGKRYTASSSGRGGGGFIEAE